MTQITTVSLTDNDTAFMKTNGVSPTIAIRYCNIILRIKQRKGEPVNDEALKSVIRQYCPKCGEQLAPKRVDKVNMRVCPKCKYANGDD